MDLRKLVLSVAAAVLLAPAFVFAEVNLIFWHGIESPDNVKVLQEKVDLFQKSNPGILVTLQSFGASDQANQKIMTAIAGKKTPDLLWWGNQTTGGLAKTGALVKISDRIRADKSFNKSDIPDGLWEANTYKGEIYGVPFGANNLAIYYNKDLFAKAGLKETDVATWDGFLAAAQKLTKDGVMGFELPMGTNEWTVWTWQTFLWANGGEFLDSAGAKPLFGSAAGVEALQFWVDLGPNGKYKVASFSEADAGYKTDNFLSGRVAMMINGPWNKGVLEGQDKVKYGVVPIPRKVRHATNLGGENMYLFKSTKEKEDAAWKFAKFIMSSAFQIDWATATGYLPTVKSAAEDPAYKAVLAGNEFLRKYFENVQYGKARPPIAAYNAVSAALGKEIEKALYGTKTAKKALEDATAASVKELK